MLKATRAISTHRGVVIEPVAGDLKLSIPRIKTIPEICPMSRSSPFDVPSGAGKAISAPYWKPIGPALSSDAPRRNEAASRSA